MTREAVAGLTPALVATSLSVAIGFEAFSGLVVIFHFQWKETRVIVLACRYACR